MNLLDLVPAFERQLGTYIREEHTESKLAGYLADSVKALSYFWTRTYEVTYTEPETYMLNVTIDPQDERPIILMGSIIYKMGNTPMAAFSDGDFSYNPPRGAWNPIDQDRKELERYIGKVRLAKPTTAPLRGFNNVYNPESYNWWQLFEYLNYH